MFDLKKCEICPRRCGADRTLRAGACGETQTVRVARAAPHFWEEPPISGSRGSGTIFFTGCSLKCVYCQNRRVSRGGAGRPVTVPELAELCAGLEERGVHNINFVTPTHFTPQIMEAVRLWRAAGGGLPVVWNTGGYERRSVVRALNGTVDIWLTDLKYAARETAAALSAAPDYPEVAWRALDQMAEQAGAPRYDSGGMLRRGVIVRLLVLPAYEHEAMMNLRALHARYGERILISLMNQYTPVGADLPPALREPLPEAAYRTVVSYARKLGLKNVFIQEGGTAKESFIPPFGKEDV